MKIILASLIISFYSVSLFAQKPAMHDSAHALKEVRVPVPLFGFTWDHYGVTIIVQSNGNTQKNDFRVEKHVVGDVTSLTFIKIHDDKDKETPFRIWITFKPEELGLKPNEHVIITNRFTDQYYH